MIILGPLLLVYIVVQPFVSASSYVYTPNLAHVPIENKRDLERAISRIFNVQVEFGKGGAKIAKELLLKRATEKGYAVDYAYNSLYRSPYVAILPRCFCKFIACAIPACISLCFNDNIQQTQPFECLSCLGDCIPLFTRCFTGIEH